MIDDRQRELERRTKQGDPDALAALQRDRRRTARCAGTVHDPEDLTEDQERLRNGAAPYVEKGTSLGLLKRCEVCGELVRLLGRDRT